MFKTYEDKSIHVTRGDIGTLEISIFDEIAEEDYMFKSGDVVRLTVFAKKNHSDIVLQKDLKIQEGGTTVVDMFLSSEDTRIGGIINKPKDYWYEYELNPDTAPQTFICYDDEEGAKLFRLYPEGGKE